MPLSADRYDGALRQWLALGAADLDERLPEAAAAVGLDVDLTRPLGSLSGGQAARASLVAVLLSHYDVLLLDEPTNNLDARGLDLMADFVHSHTGPVLIASHDRAFLDAVTTSVVELDLHQQRIGYYAGSYSAFVAERARRRGQAWDAYQTYAGARDSLWHRHANAMSGLTRVVAACPPAARRTSTSERSTRHEQTGRQQRGRESSGLPTASRSWSSPGRSGSCATPSPRAALRRRRRHALRRSRLSWIVHPWPREPGCRTRRSDRAHG